MKKLTLVFILAIATGLAAYPFGRVFVLAFAYSAT